MSERWGKCRTCKGRGIVMTETGQRDAVLLRPILAEQECGTCGGTGHGGAAEDAPWLAGDDQ